MSGKIYCLTESQIEEIKAEARADAFDECEKEIKKHYQYDCEIGGYIRLRELDFEQLKMFRKG